MTWSVSASGLKNVAKQQIEDQVRPSGHTEAEQGLKRLVDDLKGTHVSISGSGSDGTFSISGSAWTPVQS